MSRELFCTIASAGNCPWYNLESSSDSSPQRASSYMLIEVEDAINMNNKYSCKVCRGKNAHSTERDCIEVEKLNLLSKLLSK